MFENGILMMWIVSVWVYSQILTTLYTHFQLRQILTIQTNFFLRQINDSSAAITAKNYVFSFIKTKFVIYRVLNEY